MSFSNRKVGSLFQTFLIIATMTAITCLLGWIVAGEVGVVWALVLSAVMLLVVPTSPFLILRMHNARPISPQESPRLMQIAASLATRAELATVPRLFYIRSSLPNAFAVGSRSNSAIALSDALLRNLTLREITAVLAHEISHIANNDLTLMSYADILSRITTTFSFLGQILLLLNLPLLLLGNVHIPWTPIIILLLAPTASTLLQLALSRTREFDADLAAVRLTQDPLGLASALAKLEYQKANPLARVLFPWHKEPQPSVLRTHPDTQQRINALLALKREYNHTQTSFDMGQTGDYLNFGKRVTPVRNKPRWRNGGFWF